MADLALYLDNSLGYVVMTLITLFLAIYLTLLQTVLTDDSVSPITTVVYQQTIAAALLTTLALTFQRGKRPAFSWRVLSLAFFTALLQIYFRIPTSEVLQTSSLHYVSAAFLTVGLNVVPVLVFVLAVVTGREGFEFRSANGQAKLLGVVASTSGAVVLVVCRDPGPGAPASALARAGARLVVGCVMLGLAVLAQSTSMVLVERLALMYPADLTLSATMSLFGTLQTVVLASFMERNPSSWRIGWNNKLQLLTIFLGGTVTTGLVYFGRNWCVHKKGAVFTAAFSPLLVVFSFLLQVLVLKEAAQISSIFAAVLVIGGLYLLLWAKSKENQISNKEEEEGMRNSQERLNEEALLA